MKQKLWKGTLKELVELAKTDKEVAKKIGENAAARLYNAVISYGVEEKETLTGKKIRIYNYFQRKVFGQEIAIDRLMNILKGMAAGTPKGRSLVIMVGPPGSGKSTIAEMLRKSLRNVKAYRIKDSPWNENPLKAIPEDDREKICKNLDIKMPIGNVSAWSRKHYPQIEDDDWENIPVEEYKIKRGQGTAIMGTTDDPANVDLSKMIGSQILAKMTQLSESDPDSWDWKKAALVGANNGILEIVEILKLPTGFYKPFSQIAQESVVEIPGIETFEGLDVVIIGHTNEAEYKKFLAKEGSSWLRDRVEIVNVSYVLNYKEEAKIYKKLVDMTDYRKIHKSPELYEQIAKLVVATRLVKDEKVDFFEKVLLYAGEHINRELNIKIEDLINYGKEHREGMTGISPRTIVKLLLDIVLPKVKNSLFILDLIDEMEKFFEGSEDPTKEDRPSDVNARLPELINALRILSKNKIKEDVINCFLYQHISDIKNLFDVYIASIRKFRKGQSTEREEQLMRRIENKFGITESEKTGWRAEMLAQKEEMGSDFKIDNLPKLHKAIQAIVLEDLAPIIQLTLLSENVADKKEKTKSQKVLIKQLEGMGYSEEEAKRVLKIAINMFRETV